MTEESAKKQLEEIQFQLANIISEMGGYKGRSTNSSLISALFYLNDEYSQDELKKISNLSKGTISKVLKQGVETGFLKKTKKKDPLTNKKKSYYSATGSFLEDFQKLQGRAAILEAKILEKLEDTKQKLLFQGLQNETGFSEMKKFCSAMEDHLIHKAISIEGKNTKSPEFSQKITDIEQDFIIYLTEALTSLGGRDLIFAKTIGYFFTRQVLTQKQLKSLTGLSAGAISKILNFYVEIGLVKKKLIPGTHSFNYIMDGISFGRAEYQKRFKSRFTQYMGQLNEMSEILKKNEGRMKVIKGYSKTIVLIQQLQMVISGALTRM